MNKVSARDRKNTNRFQISIETVSPKILKPEFGARQSGVTIWINLGEVTGILKALIFFLSDTFP